VFLKSLYRSIECNFVCREADRQLVGDRAGNNSGKRKDDGQLNTYDWSSPAKGATLAAAAAAMTTTPSSLQSSSSQRSRSQMPVPVPIYCEPVTTTDSTMKVAQQQLLLALIVL